jgi:uncharacterized protein (TIGR02145 family)
MAERIMVTRKPFLIAILALLSWGCKDQQIIETKAGFSIFPPEGDTLTLFLFDATSTVREYQDTWRVKVRWDWDADGEWDTDFSLDKTAIHRYQNFGEKRVRMEVLDITGATDTVSKTLHVSLLIQDSVIIDSRDNQSYSIKRINHIWWMTQDLAFGNIISDKTSPKDNGIAERWIYPDSSQSQNVNQGFYTELEATCYYRDPEQGICPKGWQIPTIKDCVDLNTFFWNRWSSFVRNDSLTYQFNPVYHGFYYINTGKFHDTDQSNYYLIRQSEKEFSYAVFSDMGFSPAWWNSDMQSSWENKLKKPFNRQWLGFAVRCIKKD